MLFTALIGPYFIDWTSYKQDFERETSRVVGQNVEVLGQTSVRLLPLPSVTFGGLAVGQNADGTPMMTVDQFAMDIELLPLLKREIRIVRLNLLRPRVNLHVDDSGAIAWTNRQALAVNPELIELENFTVTNGEVKINGLAGGRTLLLEQLSGRLSAKSLYGPWRMDVDGYVAGKQTHLDISTGHLQDDGGIRVKLAASRADLPYKLALVGDVKLQEGLLQWAGEFELGVKTGKTQKAGEALPILSEGKFVATPRIVDVPEFRLEIGAREDPYIVSGSGNAKIDDIIQFKIIADGRQIDLDRLGLQPDEEKPQGGLGLEKRLGFLKDVLGKIPVPSAQGTIDLSLPAIVAGDTLIREISTVVSPDNEGWEIKQLSAIFPGNTKFEARGKVGLRQAFGFNGSMLVASRQPTGLAAWLGKRNNPFIRRLRSAGFSADVVISDQQISLENLDLVLDKAVLKGKLQRLNKKGSKPTIIAHLEGDDVNLDDLRALFALTSEDDTQAVTHHDLDIGLTAKKLTGFDLSAQDVAARFRVSGGSVSVEKLNASHFFGSTITSSGNIENLLKQPNGNFKLNVKAEQALPLLKFVQSRFPQNDALNNLVNSGSADGALDLQVEINSRAVGGAQALLSTGSTGQAIVKGVLGTTALEMIVEFEGKPEDFKRAKYDISVSLDSNHPTSLMRQLGMSVLPLELDDNLAITGSFTGVPLTGFDSFITAQMLETNIAISGLIHGLGKPSAEALLEVNFGSQDIGPLLLLAGFGQFSDQLLSQSLPMLFSGGMEIKENHLRISKGKGQLSDQDFAADLDFEKNTGTNHRINGKISAASVDLSFLSQLVFNGGKQGGEKTWSEAGFGEAVARGIDGRVDLDIARSDFGLGAPATHIKGQLALVDGAFNFNDITGKWLGGTFDTHVSLLNREGIGSLNAQFEFKDIQAKALAQATGFAQFVEGRVNLLGNLEGSGRTAAAMVSALTGSGALDLMNARLLGLNTAPLEHVLKAADVKGFEIQEENVLPVLEQVVDDGVVDITSVSIPYIVTAGNIRARNILYEAEKTNLVGALEIDVKNSTTRSELSVRIDPGNAWVDGAEPQFVIAWNGDISGPKRQIDVQPLSGYLSLRNFEREQRRVDLLQAAILEKQRLRRDIIITNARVRYRQRLRDEESRRQRQAFLQIEERRLRDLAARHHLELLAKERVARQAALRKAEEAEQRRKAKEAEQKRLAAEQKRQQEEARKAEALKQQKLEAAARKADALKQKQEREKARKAADDQAKQGLEKIRQNSEADRLRLEQKAQQKVQPKPRQKPAPTIIGPQPKPVAEKPARRNRQKLNDNNFAKRLNEFLDER